MKKYIVLLLGLMAYFTSCTDQDEVDIKYQVDFTVSPGKIMENFKEVQENAGDLDLGDEYQLRLSVFVYDAEENLVVKKEKLVEDYNTDFNFSEILPSGSYKVIGLSSVVKGNSLDNLEIEFYTYSEYNHLNNFTIEQYNFSRVSILGLTEASLTVEDGSGSVNLQLKPATSMLEVHWMYPQLFNLGSPTGHQLLVSNETFSGLKYSSPAWEAFNQLGTSRVWILGTISEEECTQTKYRDIYAFYALLPQELTYYAQTNYVDKSGNSRSKTYGHSTITLEAGKQHVLDITPNSQTTESIGTRSSHRNVEKRAQVVSNIRVKSLIEEVQPLNSK